MAQRLPLPLHLGVLVFVLPLVATLSPDLGWAQYSRTGDAATRGVSLPGSSLTLSADAAALETNPAQAAWLQSWSALLGHTELAPDSRFLGTGTGAFFALRLPLVPMSISLGAQLLRPPDGFGDRYPDMGKLSLGLAGVVTPWLSLGLAGHVFVAPGTTGIHGKTTLDAGLTLRPVGFLSIALVARDLTGTSWAGLPLQRLWDLEVGFRPLGSDRLGIALGVQVGERRRDVSPRLLLEGAPFPGLTLFADATWLRRDLDDSDGVERRTDDVRITAGIRLDFERVGFSAAFLGGYHDRPGGAASGGSAWLRLSGSRHETVTRDRQRVLLLDLEKAKNTRAHWAQVSALHEAARSPGVRAVILKLGATPPWAQGEELRNGILALRRAGKPVVAFIYSTNGQGYYVASAADRIFLFPGGGLRFAGLSSTRIYVKDLLDRLGIKAEVVRHAEYKEAPEMFTRTSPSEPAKRVRDALLDEFAGRLHGALAARPKIPSASAAAAILDKGPFTAAEALGHGLVDALVWPDELPGLVFKLIGRALPIEGPPRAPRQPTRWGRRPAVAIVAVEGDIVDGSSQHIPLIDRTTSGAKTLVKTLAQVAADPRIEAVVLRVESGGGSALASEVIWRVVRSLAQSKPVVASLGNVAASGGYFVAAPARVIFASPSTLTGSIGIFSARADLSGLLPKAGVAVDVQKRGARADLDSPYRANTPAERAALQKKLEYYYHRFLDAVAQGRKPLSTRAKVEPLAKGRLWSGRRAREQGLVDREGGLWDAVMEARRLAGFTPGDGHEVILLPRPDTGLLARAARLLAPSTKVGADPELLTRLLAPIGALPPSLWLSAPHSPLARMPFEITIE
ncbi:MAG: signal peptide peptidase SppA [Polyangia bacterium]|nr:signal peptide peptidase SppA [Polyangia bacterium]